MKIQPVHQQEAPQTFSSAPKPSVVHAESIERVALREAPKISQEDLRIAKLRAEIDFDRVKEMVRKSTPAGAYPPLDGIDRLSNLFGKMSS